MRIKELSEDARVGILKTLNRVEKIIKGNHLYISSNDENFIIIRDDNGDYIIICENDEDIGGVIITYLYNNDLSTFFNTNIKLYLTKDDALEVCNCMDESKDSVYSKDDIKFSTSINAISSDYIILHVHKKNDNICMLEFKIPVIRELSNSMRYKLLNDCRFEKDIIL